jgi:hypothetical protein
VFPPFFLESERKDVAGFSVVFHKSNIVHKQLCRGRILMVDVAIIVFTTTDCLVLMLLIISWYKLCPPLSIVSTTRILVIKVVILIITSDVGFVVNLILNTPHRLVRVLLPHTD